MNACEYFIDRHITEGRGEKIAIECETGSVTYQGLFDRVNQMGNYLRTRGIIPGQRVLLILNDTPAFAISFFAAMKIGAIPVPLNTLLMPADYEYMMQDSEASAIILEENFVSKIKNPGTVKIVLVDDPEIKKNSFSIQATPIPDDEPGLWLYSSGSTGAPKACVHRGRDMRICAEYYAKNILNINENDRCFSASKLFFAYGLGNAMYYPLAVGATSILLAEPPKPEKIFATIEQYRPTLFFSVPSQYAALLEYVSSTSLAEEVGTSFASVRCAISAGESLPAALFERFKMRFGLEILDGIGSTEALQAFITNRPGEIRPGASGKIIPGYEAKILNDDGKPVLTGEIGNLFIKNGAVCICYWNQPEKTQENIRDGWLKTGDKFREDAEGYFWYAGRIDDMFKVSGVWVSPVEIESILMEHPAVLEAAVVGKKDNDELLKPVAYIALKNGIHEAEAIEDELRKMVLERLPVYKRLRRIEFVEALPKTATGKVQRFKLRAH